MTLPALLKTAAAFEAPLWSVVSVGSAADVCAGVTDDALSAMQRERRLVIGKQPAR